MKVFYGVGNVKLGPQIGYWSRPVGSARRGEGTCSDHCLFAGWNEASDVPKELRCYAEKRPAITEAGRANAGRVAWQEVRDAFLDAPAGIKAMRIHVGGDFLGPDGELDRAYTAALLRGIRAARRAGCDMPAWFYTHDWWELTPHRRFFERLGVETFASVHGRSPTPVPVLAGWRLAVDPGPTPLDGPRVVPERPVAWDEGPVAWGEGRTRVLTCPEQRGKADCGQCGFCFRPRQGTQIRHVGFWRHT